MQDRPSWRLLMAVTAMVTVVFLLAYWRSFGVLPASDDFSYINEVHRGTQDGVGSFFTRSVTAQTYRPLTSVGLWAFGNLWGERPTVGIRVLHLLSAVGYAAVALPWIRLMRLGRAGAVAVIALMLLHPVLPQAVGSIDGFNSLASSAFLWLGAYLILLWRDHFGRAIVAAVACFAIGAGFKEYAFALVPLSILAVLCFWRDHRWRDAILYAFVLGSLLVFAVWIRRYTVPKHELTQGGWEYLSLNPVDLARNVVRNAALLGSGILFFGNSVWVYVNRSPAVLATAAGAMLAVAALVAGGIALRWRPGPASATIRGSHAGREPMDSVSRWLSFLVLSFAAASFPANVMTHVSEMYVPPIVLPFALLCGLAADGWMAARVPGRAIAGAAAAVMLVFSVVTIRDKIDGLVDVGLRADRQMRQILSFLPADARDMTVGIRYLASVYDPRRHYAVFLIPDNVLLVHHNTLEWPLPDRGIVLDSDTVFSFSDVDPSRFDLALGWDADAQRFFRLLREPGSGASTLPAE